MRMLARLSGKTVLILEDEPLIAFDLEIYLAEAGGRVMIARTCAEALSLLQTERIDMAALDFQVGDETCERVAWTCRQLGTPFVITTGYPAEQDQLGAAHWLVKPFNSSSLLAVLATISSKVVDV
jgi:DNA-binding response OmpR family regulator